ncbi:MAG TPA: hypothetical protein DCS87_13205 [Rheinheimera sp.]|nr:hypothetical protein [Rheinheimera sp.]
MAGYSGWWMGLLALWIGYAEAASYQVVPCADSRLAKSVECGVLTVPRDRLQPDLGNFELAVVRKKAAQPQGAPILYLHGGPGSGITAQAAWLSDNFAPGHDIVLLDQRGSGRSQPRLCESFNSKLAALVLGSSDDATWQQSRHDLLVQCVEEMNAAGFKAHFYGSAATVQDAEDLRQALQIPAWNLYSVSYGTVVASRYLAQAPQALKAVVMDSPYLPDPLLHSYQQNQRYLVTQLQQLCRADAACTQQFGDLTQLYQQALTQLELQPLMLTLHSSGKPFVLTSLKLQYLLNLAASHKASMSMIGWWLQAVQQHQHDDLQSLLQLAQGVDGINVAAFLGAECSERERLHQPDGVDALESVMSIGSDICPRFTSQVTPWRGPVATDVPVLLLSGGLDLFQPDAQRFASVLGRSSNHVAVPAALHQVMFENLCIADTVQQFWQQPTSWQAPSCLANYPMQSMVSAAISDTEIAQLWQQLFQGQLPWTLAALALLIAAALLAGLLWPLLRLIGLVVTGQSRRVHVGPLKGGSAVLSVLWLLGYAGLVFSLEQALQRQSGEWLAGWPQSALLWQRWLVFLLLPAAILMHQALRFRALRQALTQALWCAAALLAMALHLIP